MPVMAKLSRKLYDTLGEDVVDQLAAWMNQVYDYQRLRPPAAYGRGSGPWSPACEWDLQREIARARTAITQLSADVHALTAELAKRPPMVGREPPP